MGRPKLLLPWDGETVIHQVLRIWLASRVRAVTVVVHPDDIELASAVESTGAQVVRPETPPVDMKASVRAGLSHVRAAFSPGAQDAWLLAPADMPLLPSVAIDEVIAAHNPARPRIIVPVHRGRRGHPVLFPWPLAAEVERLPERAGVDHLVRSHPTRELVCPHGAVLDDLDTMEDYRRQQGVDPP